MRNKGRRPLQFILLRSGHITTGLKKTTVDIMNSQSDIIWCLRHKQEYVISNVFQQPDYKTLSFNLLQFSFLRILSRCHHWYFFRICPHQFNSKLFASTNQFGIPETNNDLQLLFLCLYYMKDISQQISTLASYKSCK